MNVTLRDVLKAYCLATLVYGFVNQARFVYQEATGNRWDFGIIRTADALTGSEVIDISHLPASGKRHMLEYYQMETELGVERTKKK